MRRARLLSAAVWLWASIGAGSPARGDDAAAVATGDRDLTSLSIEELAQIEVTSVSKKAERLSETGAAVYVITKEDIRRSGLHSIPELLRMAPGVEVARIDANKWAITVRGFNGRFANKLLVLIDGRSVYTPLFSGVFWDVQDTMLEDVERIEVIRGPGAAMWGANAVDGVINIITKSARDTEGGLVVGAVGNEERARGAARWGGQLRDGLYYRVWAKYVLNDNFVDSTGADGHDGWQVLRGGFRLDWDATPLDLLTLQGDIYGGEVGTRSTIAILTPPFTSTFDDSVDVAGGNILGRWTHSFSETSQSVLQLYYDRTSRSEVLLDQDHDTFDVDFQHRFRLGRRQEVLWGLGYRAVMDHLGNGPTLSFDPKSREVNVWSAFIQDEVALVPDRLKLTLGSKFEHNDFTGFEIQPSARVVLTPGERSTVWGAVSRAVRTPSRVEEDVRLDFQASPGTLTSFFGSHDFDFEELVAYEMGYRIRPARRVSLDLATFYNVYDRLFTLEPRTPFLEGAPPPPHVLLPLVFENKMNGETYGVEAAAQVSVTDWWKLGAGYTFLRMQLHTDKSSAGLTPETPEKAVPRNQFNVRSYLNLPGGLEADVLLFYVDRLPTYAVPHYFRLDARLGWHPWKDLELSAGVQNILDNRHPEFGSEVFTNPTEIERAYYFQLVWHF